VGKQRKKRKHDRETKEKGRKDVTADQKFWPYLSWLAERSGLSSAFRFTVHMDDNYGLLKAYQGKKMNRLQLSYNLLTSVVRSFLMSRTSSHSAPSCDTIL